MRVFRIVANRNRALDRQLQNDAFDGMLGTYRRDGHILGRELMTVSDDLKLEAYVFLPANDAFDPRFYNNWIRKSIADAAMSGLSEPDFVEVGNDSSELDGCQCTDFPSLILFTTYLQIQSPVRCGRCFRPVPLYRLPRIKGEESAEVISWNDDYKACDSLFMNSATGERFGYREMSKPDSSLSRRGREICRFYENSANIPCYYYLHRYYGRSKSAEENRRCPGCGCDWHLNAKWHNFFDFRCDSCRLISNLSSAVF